MSKTVTSKLKVRYAETDQMGVVYHGNYATYLEVSRNQWLENMGVSYKKMEKEGVALPVVGMQFQFKKPAFYDQLLSIKTTLRAKPTVRITFDFEIYNQEQELLTVAEVSLAFIDTKRNQPIPCPKKLLAVLENAAAF